MSSKYSKLPKKIAPYVVHGCDLRKQEQGDWVGDCPFCTKPKHFFVAESTGMYDCKVCGCEGNAITFLTAISDFRRKSVSRSELKKLEELRGIPAYILRKAGAYKLDDEWHLPVLSHTGTVRDIRRWNGRMMMATTGCDTQLYGGHKLVKAPRGTRVWLCEGEWDALALEWLLDKAGIKNDVVVGTPGSTTLKREWVGWFNGMQVIGCYDNDDAGDKGIAKAVKLLKGRCKSLGFVHWPTSKSKGFDVRDFVTAIMANRGAKVGVRRLLSIVRSGVRTGRLSPEEESNDKSVRKKQSKKLKQISFEEVISEFKNNGVMMNQDMEDILLIIFAVHASSKLGSDPLWLFVVAAPASGKTLLLSALLSLDSTVFRSTLTPHCLVSGWKAGTDPSLIPQLSDSTFILKDFTEILSMPTMAQDEIFSTLRGAYDGSVIKTFGNGEHREYSRHTDPPFNGFNMIAGVTNAIHARSDVSLGERFLKVNMRPQSREHSELIHLTAINAIGKEIKQEESIQRAVEAFLTKQMEPEDIPTIDRDMAKRLDAIVRLIATMRASVPRDIRTNDIQYRPSPEAGTRLMKQLGKLAMSIAFVRKEKTVSEAAFNLVRRVAFDTAYGFHLDIVEAFMVHGGEAIKSEIAQTAALPTSTVTRRFEDLILLKVIEETNDKKAGSRGRPATVYRVSKEIRQLWMKQKAAQNVFIQQQNTEQGARKLPIRLGRKSRVSTKKLGRPRRA